MVKYVPFDSIDEFGIHFHSLEHENRSLTKVASNNYSKDVMDAIAVLKREPLYYYIVINALGSLETWGPNRNGDGFPRSGLSHYSLRSDMGTKNDYGYKTFEYYAYLYKHHVNKDPKKSFGKVIYSSWNPKMERVELIVGVDREKGKDIIDAVENDELVSVSMGTKVPYDQCSICGNKAKTLKEYCYHLKNYMGKFVTADLARKWSAETKKNILPGSIVFAYNFHPKFFDISKVFVGADTTAYVLGKVATKTIIPSAAIADAIGVTDEMIDKLSEVGKRGIFRKESEIEKEVGSPEQTDPDGKVVDSGEGSALKKILEDKLRKTIELEEPIDNDTLDAISSMDLREIFSTMFGLGIHPKPHEVQRIVIVKIGGIPMADELDEHHIIFDPSEYDEPMDIDISPQFYNPSIARMLTPYIEKRSIFPTVLGKRMVESLEKKAHVKQAQRVFMDPKNILSSIASLYAGLKMKAMNMGVEQMLHVMSNLPWIPILLGGGIAYRIMSEAKKNRDILLSLRDYQNGLPVTHFSGHVKNASIGERLALSAGIGLASIPIGYILNAYNQKSMYETGRQIFPLLHPMAAATLGGSGAFTLLSLKERLAPLLASKIKTLR